MARTALVRPGAAFARAPSAALAWAPSAALALTLVMSSAMPGRAAAQTDGSADDEPLKVHVFTFEHQSADDALGEIRPLFSDRGSVELKHGGDTVILRDQEDELEKILRALRDFDHPRRSLQFQLHLLRAQRAPFSPPQLSTGVSPALVGRLKQVLTYEAYESMSTASFVSTEGEQVAYDFGNELGMEFRVGTVLQGARLGLRDFRVLRRPAFGIAGDKLASGGVAVLHANVVLRLGQTLAMVLTRDEAADSALVIAITCDPARDEPEG